MYLHSTNFNSKIDIFEKIKVVSSANKTDLKVSDIFGSH